MRKTLIFFLLTLVSCAPPNRQAPSPSATVTAPKFTQTSTIDNPTSESTPTSTAVPPTHTSAAPTSTPTQGLDVMATLVVIQAALDTASAKIATLEAKNNATSLPQPTSTTHYSPTSQIPQSSPTPSTPSNVTTAVIISSKANLRYTKKNTAAGNPIMLIYEPRIKLEQGSYTWIYKDPIMSDGGIIYYEIHDPDGVVTTVFYIRKVDVQVRSEAHNTSYGPVPLDVAKAKTIDKTNLRIIRDYNDKGVPIMGIPAERVILQTGDFLWIYPVPIESDGNVIYYLVFDPDGYASRDLYVRDIDIEIPNTIQ